MKNSRPSSSYQAPARMAASSRRRCASRAAAWGSTATGGKSAWPGGLMQSLVTNSARLALITQVPCAAPSIGMSTAHSTTPRTGAHLLMPLASEWVVLSAREITPRNNPAPAKPQRIGVSNSPKGRVRPTCGCGMPRIVYCMHRVQVMQALGATSTITFKLPITLSGAAP